MANLGKFPFSVIFPKTFSYLHIYVPLRHPKYLQRELDDINVIIKKGTGVNFAGFRWFPRAILIWPEQILQETAIKNIDLGKKSDLLKVLRYLDGFPKYQTNLIHEYEHSLQEINIFKIPLGLGKTYPFAHQMLGLKDNTVLSDMSRAFLMLFSRKYRILDVLYSYSLDPKEVEARFSEWIFLKVKGYDTHTIGCLDYVIGKSPVKLEQDLQSINAGLDELARTKPRGWRTKAAMLEREKINAQELLKVYPTIDKEAERMASLLKKRMEILKSNN